MPPASGGAAPLTSAAESHQGAERACRAMRQALCVIEMCGGQGSDAAPYDRKRAMSIRPKFRSCSMQLFRIRKVWSISASLVSSESENRRAPWARSVESPSAVSTCEGSPSRLAQALPPDAHTPRSSSSSTSEAESTPSNDMSSVPGTRGSAPFMQVPEISSRIRRCSSFLRRAMCRAYYAMFVQASSAAAAIPTMPATFSVPPRRPRSWRPPSMRGSRGAPSRA